MTFRFFGDSWMWTWLDFEFFQSQTMLRDGGASQNRFSTMKHLFRSFGFDVAIECTPGTGPETTLDILSKITDHAVRDHEIWIWFISNIQRDGSIEEYCYDQGLDAYLRSYDLNLQKIISEVSNRVPDHITLLLAGGYNALPKRIFDKINTPSNVFLMTENILKDLFEEYDCNNITNDRLNDLFERYQHHYDEELLRRFLFCDTDYFNKHSSDKVDRSIDEFFVTVNKVRLQYNEICGNHPHIWPDHVHLGFSGQVCLVDKIFKFCEDNNLL